MKKSNMFLLTLVALAASVSVTRAQTPTLLVRMPFTDVGSGTNCVSDTSTGGSNVTLTMFNSNNVATDYHGTAGGGVSGLGVALDFSTNTDFSTAGEPDGQGVGPIAENLTSTGLNFGAVPAYTATIWFKQATVASGTGGTYPRILILGGNGVTDKATANSIGIYYDSPNQIAAAFGTSALNGTATGTTTFAVDQWYFIALTYDGTTATVYQGTDGSAATSVVSGAVAGAGLTLNNANGSVLAVGNRPALSRPFNGWLDDFRFYSGAASANFVEDIRWSSVAPTNLTISMGNNQTVLSWNALGGAASYNVLRSTSLSGPFTSLASAVTTTNYTDTVAPGTYYYEVSAVNSAGDATTSAASQPVQNVVIGPGSGVNLLVNPGFETGSFTSGWTSYNQASVIKTNATYYNGGSGGSNVVAHSGAYTGNTYNSDFSGGSVNYNGVYQNIASAPGSTYWAYGWAYTSPEDLIGAPNSFWFELEFLNSANQLLSLWQSSILTNSPAQFPDNIWVLMAITNQYQVNNPGTATAAATATIITNAGASGIITAPAGSATVRYQVVFRAANNSGGSVYFDDLYLDKVTGANPPFLTNITSLNNVILATNRSFSYTVVSPGGLITNAYVVQTTSTLGGATTTLTNNLNNLTVVGLGTGTAVVTCPLQSNLVYSLTVYGTDENGISVSASQSFDTVSPALVIEASDFNFNGGQFLDTPANGGLSLYAGMVGQQGIDENKLVNNQGATDNYRGGGDPIVTQGAAPVNGTPQKFVTAAASGDTNPLDVPQEVGYNSAGDWVEYTRTYGPGGSAPAGTYNLWARLATQGSGLALNVYQITNGQGTSSQAASQIGSFSFTDNNWNGYDYVPMVDSFGNLVSISLSGQQTIRSQVVGNPNNGFYMLMPATAILTPGLKFSYPDGIHPFDSTNNLTFTVGPNQGSNILSSGISLVLNGVNVTSSLTLSQSGNTWTANYPIASNSVYTAVISVTNTAGSNSVITINFDTFNITNYQWEAVDYDFSTNNGDYGPPGVPPPQGGETLGGWVSAQFIDNPVPTADITGTATSGPQGTLETNSYFSYPASITPGSDFGAGAIAQQGVDINIVPNGGQGAAEYTYRSQDGVGNQVASDYLRPKFTNEQVKLNDPNIGLYNVGYIAVGNWFNYTRHYPAGSYNIWGRLANQGAYSLNLGIVTNGVGTGTQVVQPLGTFTQTNGLGYQAWQWIPLLDTNGNMVVFNSTNAAVTFKATAVTGLNMEYFMLVPAAAGSAPPFTVTPSLVGGKLNLSFPTASGHNYTVLYKSSLSGAWAAVGSAIAGSGSVTNVTETLTGAAGFYAVEAK